MSDPFLLLYRFFKERKIFFFLFLTLVSGIIILFASRIRFEEDISRLTGGQDTLNQFEYVTSHHQFAEKLIITFSQADTTQQPNNELLITAATEFSDSLRSAFDSTFIKEIRTIEDSVISVYIDFFFENIPIYLDEKDYSRIDRLLNPDSIDQIIKTNYHSLITPAGFAFKKSIARDPLGLTFMALKKLQSLRTGQDFDIIDGYIFTKDHRNILLFITPANLPSETSKNGLLIKGIDKLLSKHSDSSVKTSYFGAVAMAAGNAAQIKKDIILTLTIAIILIISLIGWYFKNIKIPILGFLPALFGGGFALAILSITKGSISAIALGIGSVILGLIVDYALYIVTYYRKIGTIEKVIREMSPAILLCALTSAGAFICLVFLKSDVLHDLGWFAALSVSGAAIFSLFVLPHFVNDNLKVRQSEMFIDKITAYPYEKNKILTIFLILAIIIGTFFVNSIDFERNMMKLNYADEKLSKAEKDLDRISSGSLKNIYVVSTGNDIEEALRTNEKAETRLKMLKTSGKIVEFSGVGSLLLSDSLQQVRLSRWKQFWTPEKVLLLQTELLKAGEKYGFRESAITSTFSLIDKEYSLLNQDIKKNIIDNFLSDFIQFEKNMVMITSLVKVEESMTSEVHNEMPSKKNLVVFDRQQITERFIAGVKSDFQLLVTLSMIFVTLLLLVSFGRIEIAFFAALPMYASWLITLGFMGITGIKFNIFNIILSSFIFGLGVDYSILMMRGLLRDYKYGFGEISSFKTSIFLSSLTTIFGVGALAFARHPALNSIATISVIGVTAVVLITFTLQPFLYQQLLGNRLRKGRHPVTLRIFIKTIITWANIVLIAIMLSFSGLILFILPLPKKFKESFFHWLFSKLSKVYIAVTFPTNRKLINQFGEDFSKPAIIISNHQSLIETPAFLRLHPKILILTNDWVWNSPLFGLVARLASFFNADHGLDQIMDDLREKINQGYSVLIFPEAHRSSDGHIQRFHRGAFYLAEKLQLDILPVVVFGSGEFLGKNAFWGRNNALTMKILKRVGIDDYSFGKTYSERTRGFRKLFTEQYEIIKSEEGTPFYYRKKLILNYIYKGPVLEWYLRIKMKLADNYSEFDRLIPRTGKILDIGCGYGYISYLLMMTSDKRIITGVDYDQEKIDVANNGFLKNNRISFICEDITKFEITRNHAFILSDVLHYLKPEEQKKLLEDCIKNLEPDGVILIRDADSDKEKNHKSSKLTEFFSTKIIGFNKTSSPDKELNFTSIAEIKAIASSNGLKTEIIAESSHTSNTLIVIRK